jgi:hypothetical protein
MNSNRTIVNAETRRTYSYPTELTPVGAKLAQREALRLARNSGPGWEHHAGLVVYVTDRRGVVRLEKGPDGGTVSERRV